MSRDAVGERVIGIWVLCMLVVVGQQMLASFVLAVVEMMPRFGKSLEVW